MVTGFVLLVEFEHIAARVALMTAIIVLLSLTSFWQLQLAQHVSAFSLGHVALLALALTCFDGIAWLWWRLGECWPKRNDGFDDDDDRPDHPPLPTRPRALVS
jgi:hypothetical protein